MTFTNDLARLIREEQDRQEYYPQPLLCECPSGAMLTDRHLIGCPYHPWHPRNIARTITKEPRHAD